MSDIRKFICAQCREPIESDATDAEVLAEMREAFGNLPERSRAVVCEECYRRFMAQWQLAVQRERLSSDAGPLS